MNDVCKEFLKDQTVNPKTGRKIKIGGPTHRELVKLCGSAQGPSAVTQGLAICKEFLKDQTVNPKTGRKIKIGGPTHRELVKLCEEKSNTKAGESPKAVMPPSIKPVAPVMPEGKIDECESFYNQLKPSLKKALGSYQGFGYLSINQYLWRNKGVINPGDPPRPELKELMEGIKTHGLTVEKPVIVYRNFSSSPGIFTKILKNAAIGDSVDFFSFMSTTISRNFIIRNKRYVMHILLPIGTRYLCPTRRGEKEFILLPGLLTKLASDDALGVWGYKSFE